MKLKPFLLGSALALAAVFSVPTQAAVTIGQPAPDFTLTDMTGKAHRLSDYTGKTIVLEWVNPECPFVVKHYGSGNMPNLQRSAQADGVVWLSINTGKPGDQGVFDPSKHAKWAASVKAAPSAYLRDPDGKVGKLYGAKTTPHMYVITADGTLV